MRNWKKTLSDIVGAIFMVIPLYQVIMYGLLLSEKINYGFITFCLSVSLVAFWGRLRNLALSIQNKIGKKVNDE